MGSRDLLLFDVIDRATRWKSSVRAVEEPSVTTHAGYVHVRVEVGGTRPVDCFVYDAPLVTGQAVTRLLSAAQIGIHYDRVELEAVETVANNPLVVVRADFTDDETRARGRLFVGLVPKVKLPVVCSQEASSSDAMRATLHQLTAEMVPPSDFSVDSLAEGERLLVFELWTLFEGERPVGFRQWRAAEHPSGRVSTLEIASILESRGPSLVTTDVRISEATDDEGLVLSDWLELVDGETHARAALERSPGARDEAESSQAFTYRVGGVGPQGPVTGDLQSETPLRSTYDEYLGLRHAQARGESFEMRRYLPHEHSAEPTLIRYRSGPEGTQEGRLEVGSDVFELSFDEEKMLESRRQLETTRSSRLALRLLGGG